jgi:hypothetical protein
MASAAPIHAQRTTGAARVPAGFRAQVAVLLERLESLAAQGREVSPAELGQALDLALPHVVRSRWADRIGPVYTTGQLQRLLRAEPITDEAVRDRRRSGRLIGFKTSDGMWAFPAFQLEAHGGRLLVREDVIALWRLLPWRSADQLELIAWMTGRRHDLQASTPVAHVVEHGIDEPLQRAAARLSGRLAA